MAGIEFKIAEPESVGLSAACISEYINRITAMDIPLHSLLIVKDGLLVCEAYQKPYGRDMLHRMFSVTKSMVGFNLMTILSIIFLRSFLRMFTLILRR